MYPTQDHDIIISRMAKLFKKGRKAKKLSQMELAKRLHISQGSLSKIENAQLAPTALNLLDFCKLININPLIFTDENEFERQLNIVSAVNQKTFEATIHNLDTKQVFPDRSVSTAINGF